MTIAYLNGIFKPIAEAKISPMDRGFLFGDGIYEVIPSYAGKLVGAKLHAERMNQGLAEIRIQATGAEYDWESIALGLIEKNKSAFEDTSIGVYIHVSRGADSKRFHAYPAGISPTVFAFAFQIPNPAPADRHLVKGLRVKTHEDLRWSRCHIKSTSLLGNVMHFQQSQDDGVNETILFNAKKELTEASVCNVFVIKDGVVATPPLNNQLLPGITRHILIESLVRDKKFTVQQRTIVMDELFSADEVWITSSSKEVAPVIQIDGKPVGDGRVGAVWEEALTSYHSHKFSF